jgi:glycosyltransferase involved in cell wall biosynthesis
MTSSDSPIPLISVAIATFNRAETLRRALNCVASLQADPCNFAIEAVVIDNGSTDHTKDVVHSVASNCSFPIRYCFEAQPGLPFARNRAVKESQGQWIAFFDDDQLTDPLWLDTLYGTAQKEKALCAGGSRSLLIEADSGELSIFSRFLLGETFCTELSDYHMQHLPCTGNVLVHRSLFEKWGMFDEAVLDGGEDSDFFNRVIHGGDRAVYNPAATVQHIIPPSRLDRDFLELVAFRHGRHVCRRDSKLRGKLFTYFVATSRFVVVGLSTRYRMMRALLSSRKHDVIGESCKWRRTCGYISYAYHNSRTGTESAARTMHRGR